MVFPYLSQLTDRQNKDELSIPNRDIIREEFRHIPGVLIL
jgi:hypothetical protein